MLYRIKLLTQILSSTVQSLVRFMLLQRCPHNCTVWWWERLRGKGGAILSEERAFSALHRAFLHALLRYRRLGFYWLLIKLSLVLNSLLARRVYEMQLQGVSLSCVSGSTDICKNNFPKCCWEAESLSRGATGSGARGAQWVHVETVGTAELCRIKQWKSVGERGFGYVLAKQDLEKH